MVERINQKVRKNRNQILDAESHFVSDSEVVVIANGFSARTSLYAVRRLRKEGMKVGLLRLKTLWPFPEQAVQDATAKARKVFVPEMNRGQVAGEVKKYCCCEVTSLNQTNGEVIEPETLMWALRKIV